MICPGEVAFAYRMSAALGPKRLALFLQKVPDRKEQDTDGDAVMEHRSSSVSDSEKCKPELSVLMLNARNNPEHDQSIKYS